MDYLKEKKELISIILICVSAALVISIVVKVSSFFTASARAESIITTAVEQNVEEADEIDKYFTKSKILADDLKKKNLFAPPVPKQHPVREISGIFGDEVIINNRLYKVGDKVRDAKIISIEPTQVAIEWEGKRKIFSPMDSKDSSQAGRSSRSRQTSRGRPPAGGTAQMVTIESNGFGGKEGKIKNKSEAKLQAKRDKLDRENLKNIEKRWSTLPEGVRQKLLEIKERWPNMSEGERDKVRAGLRDRFGGGK